MNWIRSSNDKTNGVNITVTSLKGQKFFCFLFFFNCRHWPTSFPRFSPTRSSLRRAGRREPWERIWTLASLLYCLFNARTSSEQIQTFVSKGKCWVTVIKKYYNKLHNNIQWCSRRLVILKNNLTPKQLLASYLVIIATAHHHAWPNCVLGES